MRKYRRSPATGMVYIAGHERTADPLVAVVNTNKGSGDMTRLRALVTEEYEQTTPLIGLSEAWERALARFANGESDTPPMIVFKEGQTVRRKHDGHLLRIAYNGWNNLTQNRVYEASNTFTSEHYDLVEDVNE